MYLFLTSSEIAGVEPSIRKYTSQYYTLSHADHYPNELVNEPTVPTKSAFVCGCAIVELYKMCLNRYLVIKYGTFVIGIHSLSVQFPEALKSQAIELCRKNKDLEAMSITS